VSLACQNLLGLSVANINVTVALLHLVIPSEPVCPHPHYSYLRMKRRKSVWTCGSLHWGGEASALIVKNHLELIDMPNEEKIKKKLSSGSAKLIRLRT